MKNLFFLTLILFQINFSFAQESTKEGPYFYVSNVASAVLPLKSTSAEVSISGVIADVTVTQIYQNSDTLPLEAVYVFPGTSRSAIYAMKMEIGDRVINAQIQEKVKAQAIYASAKSEGKRTSLLEQHRPNVFQMNVANIMPGDEIKVIMSYTELLIPENGQYQFVYPAVVGPRYNSPAQKTESNFTNQPYTHAEQQPLYDFDIDVHLSTGIPYKAISSPSHVITIDKKDRVSADIRLVKKPTNGTKDVVINYSLQGDQIESGLLLYEGEDENFFLCMIEPPQSVQPSSIPPREFVFIVDVSGSMMGFPLEVTKKLMTDLISHLHPYDKFNIIIFSGDNRFFSPHSVAATEENLASAIKFIDAQNGGGGTELINALQAGLNLPKASAGLSRTIVLVTDGYVSAEIEAFELIRNNLNTTNVFAFGIGSSVNRFLIEGLAKAGQGEPTIVLNHIEAPVAAEKFREYIQQPVLSQLHYSFEGFDAYDIEPIALPDVMAKRPVVLFGKYSGQPKGTITVTGYQGAEDKSPIVRAASSGDRNENKIAKKSFVINVDTYTPIPEHKALRSLWARERAQRLADYIQISQTENRVKEITTLGLKYNLMTQFTSFVAVDSVVAHKDGKTKTVHQPLPLPEGLTDYAVGYTLGISGISGTVTVFVSWLWVIIVILIAGMAIAMWRIRKKGMPAMAVLFLPALFLTSCQSTAKNTIRLDDRCAHAPLKLVYILGEDEGDENRYYQHASEYFHQQNQDGTYVVVENIRSIESMMRHLSKHSCHIEEVNIVAHGNQFTGLAVPVLENYEDRCNAANLSQYIKSNRFRPLNDRIIDTNTMIKLYGCSIGLDTTLINEFEKLFTNTVGMKTGIVASPHFSLFYKNPDNSTVIDYTLARNYFITCSIEKNPTIDALAIALEVKYPEASIDWKNALQSSSPANGDNPFFHQFHIPVQWTFLMDDQDAIPQFKWQEDICKWVSRQNELNTTLQDMNFKASDFWWNARTVDVRRSPIHIQRALEVKGHTRVYCVVEPFC